MSLITEGQKIVKNIPEISSLEGAHASDIVDYGSGNLREFYPQTRRSLQLIANIFSNASYQGFVISISSHNERGKRGRRASLDAFELFEPGSKNGIAIYGDPEGNLSFSIIDNSSTEETLQKKEKPKVESTKDKLQDAVIIRDTFESLTKKIGCRNVEINGPSEAEGNPEYYVVLERGKGEAIATYEGGDILGFVFIPEVKKNGTIKTVHGSVRLLVREKTK